MDEYRKKPHWTSDSDGEWAVCVPGDKVSPGTRITVFKADGSSHPAVIISYLELGDYGHLYDVDTSERDRMERADETLPLKIDWNSKSGEFLGSDGEIYETTLHSCTCQDFTKRGESCKHMYRLAQEIDTDKYSHEVDEAKQAALVKSLASKIVLLVTISLWVAVLALALLAFFATGWELRVIFVSLAIFTSIFAYAFYPGYNSSKTGKTSSSKKNGKQKKRTAERSNK